MKTWPLILTVALLAGCGADTREADLAACQAEGMLAKVSDPPAHAVLCMTGKGYAYKIDEFCLRASGTLVLWACFEHKPTWAGRLVKTLSEK